MDLSLTTREVEVPNASAAPDQVVAREREVWTNDEFKSLRRLVRFLGEKRLAVALMCPRCRVQIAQENGDGAGVDLVCGCTRRSVRRGA